MVLAWVAVMELPSVIMGTILLGRGVASMIQVFRKDPSLLLLPACFGIGAALAPEIAKSSIAQWTLQTAFEPLLAYFLFEMGRQAGESLCNLGPDRRWGLLSFGLGMPLLGGLVAAALGTAIRGLVSLNYGDIVVLATLGASASYVAAPAAMTAVISGLGAGSPEKARQAVSLSLTASVGITLPFNILIGLPLYRGMAAFLGTNSSITNAILVFAVIGLVVAWRDLLIDRLKGLFEKYRRNEKDQKTKRPLNDVTPASRHDPNKSVALHPAGRQDTHRGLLNRDPAGGLHGRKEQEIHPLTGCHPI